MIIIIEYAFIFLVLHFILNLVQDKKDKIKIKQLREEIKHERYNHEKQITRNAEVSVELIRLKMKYKEMLEENLRLNREFNRGLI